MDTRIIIAAIAGGFLGGIASSIFARLILKARKRNRDAALRVVEDFYAEHLYVARKSGASPDNN